MAHHVLSVHGDGDHGGTCVLPLHLHGDACDDVHDGVFDDALPSHFLSDVYDDDVS